MSGLWRDLEGLPQAVQLTLDNADGFDDVAAFVGDSRVKRVVATGNGAAYYVALGLWLASLESVDGPPIVAVPAGLLAAGRLALRPGDALLAVSSSGELRDLVEPILAGSLSTPLAAITTTPSATIPRHAAARAVVSVLTEQALTHTQAYVGNHVAALAIWARATRDESLSRALAGTPERLAAAVAAAAAAADGTAPPPATTAAICFGAGGAWAAALEAALLLKEVAQLPAEGQETREGATSGMTGLHERCLAVSIRTGHPIDDEAEAQCRGRGATVVGIDGGGDARLAPILAFPQSVRLALAAGEQAGLNVDSPAWTQAYYDTARASGAADPA
ncbi:MAG TPA: hypothetical protein VHC67_11070 [Gaiellaceae bacterium]|jgi:fructoselysine-6-P-deglycase FrlB-like protein|nr:hypothetical protein [Gaiellaceae bacterium]